MHLKQIALTLLLILGAFSAVTYTACNQDPCAGLNCSNGGACIGGTCVCIQGYQGTNCLTISRDKFDRSWFASELLSDSSGTTQFTYTAAIAASAASADVRQVLITGLDTQGGKPFFNNLVTATVAANTITIPVQSPDRNGYVVSGTGTYANGVITWNYAITQEATSATVNISGTWQ